jgi:Flp pilus assembly protein TadG
MPDFKQQSARPRFRLIRQQGQTLVEFAFVTLIFLIILFGLTEFSRALWTWNALVHATREGARYAVVTTSTDTEIIKYVVYHDPAGSGTPVVPGLAESNVTVQYLKNDGSVSSKSTADMIQVGVSGFTFDFLVPLYGPGLSLPAFKTTLPLECIAANCL